MNFIQELHEARLTRNQNNVRTLTYTDCCERLYLSLMILELLRKFPKYSMAARAYAKNTTSDGLYRYYKISGTDLYNFIYFVNGDESAIGKLKDPGAAQRLRDKTSLPLMSLNSYLKSIANGQSILKPSEMFIKIESNLGITNSTYKEIRRSITNFDSIGIEGRKTAVTKLLFATRAKLRSSDLIDDLEKLASQKDLESGTVTDQEPTVSLPDITTDGKDLSLYRYLVGVENLMMTKRFLDHAKQGKSVSGNMVQGYMPAIKMLDDIVKAGPGYVQMLRALHNRAKKGR